MTNREIVDIYLKNGLIRQCIECQFAKAKADKEWESDFFQDLVIILLEYENEKLLDAHINNHMNALVSRIIINQLWSNTSPYYKTYKRFFDRSDDINDLIQKEDEDSGFGE